MRGKKGFDVTGTQGQANWSLRSDLTNYHSLTEYTAFKALGDSVDYIQVRVPP